MADAAFIASTARQAVRAPDSPTAAFRAPGRSGPESRPDTAGKPRNPRSDIGTILLHWTVALACLVSIITGFRLTADAEGALISRMFSPLLMQGEVWTWHILAGLAMFFGMTAYAAYMLRSGLKRRAAIGRVRVFTLPTAARLRWGAVNVILHWVLYGLTAAMFVTGLLLYGGFGGVIVTIHLAAATLTVVYILCHVFAHFMYGRLAQLLRLFRPMALQTNRATRPLPLAVAIAIGVVAGLVAVFGDWASRDRIVVARVDEAPKLDGVLDDKAWRNVTPASIRTQQGANLGGTGESLVEIRVVRSADMVYFAFRWQDPTRSLKRLPLVKREDGWHMMHNKADIADESAFYEDKFAVLFTRTPAFGGGATFMGPRPLNHYPPALNGRGLHYTTDGTIADMWQWKASRGGHLGFADDMHIGPPMAPNERHKMNTERYSGGYMNDPGKAFYSYNYVGEPPGGYRGPVKVRFLPKDWKQTQDKLGKFELKPGTHDEEGSQWWMFDREVEPYSAERDAAIPVASVIPGVIIAGEYSGDRADVRAAAKWQDGWWTLEVSRKRAPSSRYDTDFVGTLYLWVSVFDHNQTRHTRHLRPLRVDFD